jgi:divalent metal cation (Fe/Co/Zn/Cd) transporter
MSHSSTTALSGSALDDHVRRGRLLEYFTIGWNVVEAVVAIASGLLAGSTSLIGFGIDSAIESSSGGVLLWRLRDGDRGRSREERALRLVGVCFFLLAAYVLIDASRGLWLQNPPSESIVGIVLAVVSLIVMPILARAKRKVANQIESRALHADARQTDLCMVLSAILLVGLSLNAWLGWWWADHVAALVMVPIIAREGFLAMKGESCGCELPTA